MAATPEGPRSMCPSGPGPAGLAPGSLEFQDGHPFGRGVVWPASRIDPGKPSVLDSEFLAEQLSLLLELVVVGGQSDAGVGAVGGPAASRYDRVVSQGNGVQDGGLDVPRPSGRKRDVWQSRSGNGEPPEPRQCP